MLLMLIFRFCNAFCVLELCKTFKKYLNAFWAKTLNPQFFYFHEVTKLTLSLFFESIDLSDFFCSFSLVLLWMSSTNE